jgi:hypothetical protein
MSAEHVGEMNRLLAESEKVKQAARRLDREYVIVYDLANAPAGDPEHWVMTLAPEAVFFGLQPVERADVRISADWHQMVAASRAAREGNASSPPTTTSGDAAVLTRIAEVFAVARQVSTVPVDWPELPERGR